MYVDNDLTDMERKIEKIIVAKAKEETQKDLPYETGDRWNLTKIE